MYAKMHSMHAGHRTYPSINNVATFPYSQPAAALCMGFWLLIMIYYVISIVSNCMCAFGHAEVDISIHDGIILVVVPWLNLVQYL